MKECFKCKQTKSLEDFYKHPMMKDGRVNKCKECNKQDVRDNYAVNRDHFIQYEKNRMRLPHRVEARKKYAKENPEILARLRKDYHERHPLKKMAHRMTSNAIRDKRLIRGVCVVCGCEKVEAHHEDYYKPLEVIWLCKQHHLEKHGKVLLANYKEITHAS